MKAKKTTNKEFWEVLEKIGFEKGDYNRILNVICLRIEDERKEYERFFGGSCASCERCERDFKTVFSFLDDEKHYFDNIREEARKRAEANEQ